MAKDPAVLFYVQDFLVGVSFLTPLQKGHYITLLCHQQQSETGSLSEDQVKALIGKDYAKQWPVLSQKFKMDENGYYNERMRTEMQKRKNYSESRRSNRQKIKEDMKNISGTYDTSYDEHMENENENKKGFKGVSGEQREWDSIKSQFFQHTVWMTNFCTSKKISPVQFDLLAKEFINDLELKEDFKSIKEIKSHFTAWFNKNKITLLQNLPFQKNGLSAREIEEKKNREKLGING
jgi:uncharacterized protein YdaU (DUF1376 family)